MRGVQTSAEEECDDWIPKEGERAQFAESHHQVLWLQGPAIWNTSGRHGDFAQVQVLDT